MATPPSNVELGVMGNVYTQLWQMLLNHIVFYNHVSFEHFFSIFMSFLIA